MIKGCFDDERRSDFFLSRSPKSESGGHVVLSLSFSLSFSLSLSLSLERVRVERVCLWFV